MPWLTKICWPTKQQQQQKQLRWKKRTINAKCKTCLKAIVKCQATTICSEKKKTNLFDEEVEEKYCFLHPLALDFSRTQTRAEKIFCSTMKQEHNLASRPHSLTMSHGIAAAAAAMLKNRKISKMQRKFTKSSEFCYVPEKRFPLWDFFRGCYFFFSCYLPMFVASLGTYFPSVRHVCS